MRDGDEEHLNAEPGKKCAVYFFIYDDDDDAAFAAIWTESLQRAKRRAGKQEEQQEEKLLLMMMLLLLKVTSSFGAATASAYPASPWYQIDFNDFTCSMRHDAVPPAPTPTQSTYEYEMQLHGQATTKAANVILIDKIVARTPKVSLFKRGN